MRLSEHFKLGKSQAELDFVDIDPDRDTPLYVDPHLISVSQNPFAERCHSNLDGFFSYFLELMRSKQEDEARRLFSCLHEPNETCFGVSSGSPSGRGIGRGQADKLFDSIKKSAAVRTGVLEQLQDCAIFVPGIERDKVSDMTTNIIRNLLVEYTHHQCELHGIELRPDTPVGPLWDNENRQWAYSRCDMLVIQGRPILLVPKSIVSFANNYNLGKYHTHFVLNYVKREQFRTNGPFVHKRKLKSGKMKEWVSKTELKATIAPAEKDYVANFTRKHGKVFQDFKQWVAARTRPLQPRELRGTDDVSDIAEYLESRLRAIPPGNEQASTYHNAITGVLEFLLHPSLTCPRKEREIHEGRKRIDITFDNSARGGIFWRLHQVHGIPCPHIMVECKNYGRELGNPELDQLAGRFSPNRGKVGLLVCRSLADHKLFTQRCIDTHRDHRGLVLPITDEDLLMLLKAKAENPLDRPEEQFLSDLVRNVAIA